MIPEKQQIVTRYLLGDLPELDRDRVEKEFFLDDRLWEDLVAAQNDLIDAYIRKTLSPQQRKQFEGRFLESPRRRERLQIARFLLDSSLQATPEVRSVPAAGREISAKGVRLIFWLETAALVLAAFGAIYFAWENRRTSDQLHAVQLDQSSLQQEVEKLREKVGQIGSQGTPPAIAALLEPENMRSPGGGIPRIQLPASGHVPVSLILDLARDNYPKYAAALQTAREVTLLEERGLLSQQVHERGRGVLFSFPSSLLSPGDYVLVLSGQDAAGRAHPVDSYVFSAAH